MLCHLRSMKFHWDCKMDSDFRTNPYDWKRKKHKNTFQGTHHRIKNWLNLLRIDFVTRSAAVVVNGLKSRLPAEGPGFDLALLVWSFSPLLAPFKTQELVLVLLCLDRLVKWSVVCSTSTAFYAGFSVAGFWSLTHSNLGASRSAPYILPESQSAGI